jgi:hypothetical protein
LAHIQFSGGIVLRKTIAFGAIVMLSAGLASVPASATTAKTGVVTVAAKTSAASVAAAAKARAAVVAKAAALAKARAAAAAPKANAVCKPSLSTTKIGKYQYICTKNSKKKYVWTKLSSDCVALLTAYTRMKSDYTAALKQIADMEAKITPAIIPGTAGDALRTQVGSLKSTILILGPTVSDSLAQFRTFCS